MKKIFNLFMLFSFLVTSSCMKERLIIQEKELQFDENSPEYQIYQAERAMQYIRTFRFEKIADILSKLSNEPVKKNLQDSLQKYRYIAETEALYYARDGKDTIYFRPNTIVENPTSPYKDGERLAGHFTLPSNTLVNSKGILHGFKNFPHTIEFHFYNNIATGLVGLEELHDMEIFRWLVSPQDIVDHFPNEEYQHPRLQADLSANTKLREIALGGIELGNIIFPKHQLELFSNGGYFSTGGLKFPTGSLDGLWAKEINIGGEADTDFKMTGVKSDKVSFRPAVKNFDIGQSDIKSLTIASVEKLILNQGIKQLILSNAYNLKERPNLPTSLEDLTIHNYPFTTEFPSSLKKLSYSYINKHPFALNFLNLSRLDSLSLNFSKNSNYPDFSAGLTEFPLNTLQLPNGLKFIQVSASGAYTYNADGAALPTSLQSIYWNIATISHGTLDLSRLLSLKEVRGYLWIIENGGLKLPASVEKIDLRSSALRISELDLSHLTNLQYLNISLGSASSPFFPELKSIPVRLVLPPNLKESALSITGSDKPITLTAGSNIINKPTWFDRYVQYID